MIHCSLNTGCPYGSGFLLSSTLVREQQNIFPCIFSCGGGGGGEGYPIKFTGGGSTPASKSLSFYVPFLTETLPLSYMPPILEWYLFQMPSTENGPPFTHLLDMCFWKFGKVLSNRMKEIPLLGGASLYSPL